MVGALAWFVARLGAGGGGVSLVEAVRGAQGPGGTSWHAECAHEATGAGGAELERKKDAGIAGSQDYPDPDQR